MANSCTGSDRNDWRLSPSFLLSPDTQVCKQACSLPLLSLASLLNINALILGYFRQDGSFVRVRSFNWLTERQDV